MEMPPNDACFQEKGRNAADSALIQRRQNALATKDNNLPAASNFTINFSGLSELLGINQSMTTTSAATVSGPTNGPPTVAPTSTRRPPNTTSLAWFSQMYSFSEDLYQKLKDAEISGPHILPRLTNEDLKSANLNFAQVADVRDAYDRWIDEVAFSEG